MGDRALCCVARAQSTLVIWEAKSCGECELDMVVCITKGRAEITRCATLKID